MAKLTVELVEVITPAGTIREPEDQELRSFMLDKPVPATPRNRPEDEEEDAEDIAAAERAEARAAAKAQKPLAWDEAKRRFGL